MAGTGAAFVGMLALGAGTLLLVGTVKNRKLFGSGGIVTQAIQTGTITGLGEAPQAYALPSDPNSVSNMFPANQASGFHVSDDPSDPVAHSYYLAIVDISAHNYNLAVQVVNDYASWVFNGHDSTDENKVNADIQLVRGLGLSSDADAILSQLQKAKSTG